MITFYSFGPLIESVFGMYGLLVIYFGSLLGGNALALFIHRHNDYYRALGASGAVSGIVFASILVDPSMPLYLFFIPIGIPAWIIGIAYMAYSINGMRTRTDNIGHEAHMGGALVGLGLGIALIPQLLLKEPLILGILVIPTILFLFFMIKDPDFVNSGKINWHKIFNRRN
jgi:membrane associated rhomboid family serine protease